MSRRRLIAVAIVVVWLATLAWHVRREYFGAPGEVLAAGARGLAPGTHFFVVRMDSSAIGYASASFDTLADGYLFEEQTILDVPALGNVQRAVTRTRLELDEVLGLRSFAYSLQSAIGEFRVNGGRTADSALDLQVSAGSGMERSRLDVGPDVLLDAALPLRIAAAGQLERGRELSARVFDPSAMTDRSVAVRVAAVDTFIVPDSVRWNDTTRTFVTTVYDTVPVWRLDQRYGGIAVETWVDEDGMMVRARSPLGFAIERTVFELARAELEAARARPQAAGGYGNVIESTAIASNVALDDVERAPALRIHLGGIDPVGLDIDGGRQQLRSDTVLIVRERSVALRATYLLPFTEGGPPGDELAATPLVQAEHPRIVAQARAIVGDARDPAVAAQRLNDWVYRTLRKEITLSVPSALQVLEGRRGDCNEHTVLYLALARAIGLPARTAAGVVHIRGRFYYHAWPEVWLGQSWVAVDPTLGQYPADVSHLRLVIGGLDRQVELVRVIGRLRLEVL